LPPVPFPIATLSVCPVRSSLLLFKGWCWILFACPLSVLLLVFFFLLLFVLATCSSLFQWCVLIQWLNRFRDYDWCMCCVCFGWLRDLCFILADCVLDFSDFICCWKAWLWVCVFVFCMCCGMFLGMFGGFFLCLYVDFFIWCLFYRKLYV